MSRTFVEILESFNKKFQSSVLKSQLHNRGFDNFHAPKLDGINASNVKKACHQDENYLIHLPEKEEENPR